MNNIAESIYIVPHNTESEKMLLGALLNDNNAIDRIGELPEAVFFNFAHRLIYCAIIKQAAKGKGWDVITTAELLEREKNLEKAGGLIYLGNLAQDAYSSANIANHGKIIRDHAARRQIMEAAAELTALVQGKGDINEALDKAQSKLLAITEKTELDEPKSITQIFSEHFNVLEKRTDTSKRRAIGSGLTALDSILNGGWYSGQLIVLAARTSHGKTALSMHSAIHAARAGYGVLYLSMEMVASELADRAIAALGRVNLGDVLKGQLTEKQWSGVSNAASAIHDKQMYILDKSGLTFYQVATYARRHKRKHGLDLLVLDYLQLMAGVDRDQRHTQIEEITRNLKCLAKELSIPIILLSQLSRKTENARRPKLSDLRDSGAVEQDADVVLFIHREEVDNPDTCHKNYADIYVAKNRQGALSRIGVTYHGEQVRFEEFSGIKPDWNEPAPQPRQRRGIS